MKTHTTLTVIAVLLSATPVMAKHIFPPRPGAMEALHRSGDFTNQGEGLLEAGKYLAAEYAFRAAIVDWYSNADAYTGLANALIGEGKITDAIDVYQTRFTPKDFAHTYSSNANLDRLSWAMLLSKVGRWDEAVNLYNSVCDNEPPAGDAPTLFCKLDINVPQPELLQAILHIARAQAYSIWDEPFRVGNEYEQAISLEPNSPLINYYYAPWVLGRSNPHKTKAEIEQGEIDKRLAKAAYTKAANLGDGDIKAAAERALIGFVGVPDEK